MRRHVRGVAMVIPACILNALRCRQRPFTFRFHATVAAVQGLYAFWLGGKCLYVGESVNLKNRLYQHRMQEHNTKLERYFNIYPRDIKASYVVLGDRQDRRTLEREAIRYLRPVANIAYR